MKTYMFIGAHPDDADIKFGGTAIRLLELGNKVIFVSLTDGSAGHQTMGRKELAARRKAEAQAVADFLGIEYIIMDGLDAELAADIPTRAKLIRLIRTYKPDVIIGHRPYDLHPDHNAAGQLVQDSIFLLGVPAVCPDVPYMEKMPHVFYAQDNYTRPNPFIPDILTDITPVIDRKMESLAQHVSQVLEWLPFVKHITDPIPTSMPKKIAYLKQYWGNTGGVLRFLPLLHDPKAEYVEALECCEYGAKVTPEIARDLFPFAAISLI